MLLSAGRHCCLWCTVSYDQLQTPPGQRTVPAVARTLATMKEDHDRFVKKGSDLKQAKFCNNVIRMPLLDIELDHVRILASTMLCLPPLSCLLLLFFILKYM